MNTGTVSPAECFALENVNAITAVAYAEGGKFACRMTQKG